MVGSSGFYSKRVIFWSCDGREFSNFDAWHVWNCNRWEFGFLTDGSSRFVEIGTSGLLAGWNLGLLTVNSGDC